MISRRHCLRLLAASTVAAPHVYPSALHAGQWPQRTVRLIVPVGAGSATDVAARLFADGLARRWKQPVIVENRPGADGLIGTAAFVGARDEHSLLFSYASPVSVLPAIHASLPYDPARDLVPISLATDTFVAVTVPASLKIDSLRDFVAMARSQPGRLNCFGSSGAFPYLLAGFLKSQHLDVVAVSYREQSTGMRDHSQGGTQLAIAVITSALPFVQSGHLKFLAVTNSRRSPLIPDVPTVAESGFPELAFEGMAGLFGSAGLPPELRDRIAEDVRAVADDAAVANRLAAIGQAARATTASEFSAMLAAQRAQIATIVQETGLLSSH